MKSAARPGRSQRSLTTRGMGWEGQEKRCAGMCGASAWGAQGVQRSIDLIQKAVESFFPQSSAGFPKKSIARRTLILMTLDMEQILIILVFIIDIWDENAWTSTLSPCFNTFWRHNSQRDETLQAPNSYTTRVLSLKVYQILKKTEGTILKLYSLTRTPV